MEDFAEEDDEDAGSSAQPAKSKNFPSTKMEHRLVKAVGRHRHLVDYVNNISKLTPAIRKQIHDIEKKVDPGVPSRQPSHRMRARIARRYWAYGQKFGLPLLVRPLAEWPRKQQKEMRAIMAARAPWWEDFQRLFAHVPGGQHYWPRSVSKPAAAVDEPRPERLRSMLDVLRKAQKLIATLMTSKDKTAVQLMLSLSSVSQVRSASLRACADAAACCLQELVEINAFSSDVTADQAALAMRKLCDAGIRLTAEGPGCDKIRSLALEALSTFDVAENDDGDMDSDSDEDDGVDEVDEEDE
jgi:hypothetical protein